MKKKLAELNIKLSALSIFRDLLRDPVIAAFQNLMAALEDKELLQQVHAYGEFVSCLYQKEPNLSTYIRNLILNDENFYVKEKAAEAPVSQTVETALKKELDTLEKLSAVTSEAVKSVIAY